MKYLLFAFNAWYPHGGWDDYRGEFWTLEDALAHRDALDHVMYAHVVRNGKMIARYTLTERGAPVDGWGQIDLDDLDLY